MFKYDADAQRTVLLFQGNMKVKYKEFVTQAFLEAKIIS